MYSYVANETIILKKLGLNYRAPPFKRRKRSLPLTDGPHYSEGFKADNYDSYQSCAGDNSKPFSKCNYTIRKGCSAFPFSFSFPTADVVRRKIMFSQLSVILSKGEIPIP